LKLFMKNCAVLEMLQKPYSTLDNRKIDRFPIDNGVYALLTFEEMNNHVSLVQLTDISQDGVGIN
jgi:hypothetical protein